MPIAQAQLESQAVAAVVQAMRNTSFYALSHPTVQVNIEVATKAIMDLLEEQSELVIKIVEGEIVANNRLLFDMKIGTANLTGACLRRQIESITFRRGLRTEDMSALIATLCCDPEELAQNGGALESMSRAGARNIFLEKLHDSSTHTETTSFDDTARATYASALDILRNVTRDAGNGLSPEIEPVNKIVSELIETIFLEQTAMLGLVSVKGKDEYTFTHALHICILCLEMGQALKLTRAELLELGVCALLHDIGKIFIPLQVLRKASALNQEEFEIVKQHPLHGALLLCRQENAPPAAPLVAFEHHLHYDLSGYPVIAHNHTLNFYTHLVGPADVYDALTTDRPYRAALTPQHALEVMYSQAKQFEPRLLECFGKMLGKYPPGSLVRLNDGRLAVVSRPNARHLSHPWIRIIELDDGAAHLEGTEIDLRADSQNQQPPVLSIDTIVNPADLNLDVCSLLGGNPFTAE
jgi:HD-GYP domain-containing protein (c-di-GMP phosphodiesterase class II)